MRARSRELRHEHVFERAKLVEELLKHPEKADEIADLAVACTVTRTEHNSLAAVCRLNPQLSGWARYQAAGIKVYDMSTGLERTRDQLIDSDG